MYAVCDGIGGHAGGDTASTVAIEALAEHLEQERDGLRRAARARDLVALRALMTGAVDRACAAVFEVAQTRRELAGMGCTLTACVVAETYAVVGHVGDSGAYLVRDWQAHRLTHDHTVAGELLRDGVLTDEQAERHPYRHVLSRAVGTAAAVRSDVLAVDLLDGDRLLLCSDGLTRYVDSLEWLAQQFGSEPGDLDELVHRLIDHARGAGGEDNISVVVIAAEADVAPEGDLAETMPLGLDVLGRSPIFEDLPLRGLAALLAAAELREVAAGDAVLVAGSRTSALSFILRGALRAERAGLASRILGVGDSFGETTLLRPRASLATLTALEATTVLSLPRSRFQHLLRSRPWLGVRLLERLGAVLATELDRLRAAPPGTSDPEPDALL